MFVALSLLPARATRAEPPQPGTIEQPATSDEAIVEEARERFFAGLALLRDEKWGPALAEFSASRRLHPTRAATRNAALCLRKLDRADEALTLYEELARSYSDPNADERRLREKEEAELRKLVGTIEILGLDGGTIVVVDGVERGTAPLGEPLRVASGSHTLQLVREGYIPQRVQVEVPGGRVASVTARLRPLSASGRLRVAEQLGRVAAVYVDNVRVGQTPWEGALAVGRHHVVLQVDDGLGSQPVAATVKAGEVARLTIALEPLAAQLDVRPVPADAFIAIDGVSVGQGYWRGAVRAGPHRVEVGAEGYVALERHLELKSGERAELLLQLERDRTSAEWAKNEQPRIVVDVLAGLAIAPVFAGEVGSSGCEEGCRAGVPLGALALAHGGYRFPIGVSLGIQVGYVMVRQTIEERAAVLKERPDALRTDAGLVDDTVTMQGMVAGAFIGGDVGSDWFFRGRLGTGFVIANVADRRTGAFSSPGGQRYGVEPAEESTGAQMFAVTPELHVGYRFSETVAVGLSLEAMVMVGLNEPRWTNERDVIGPDFLGFYDNDRYLSRTMLLLAPAVGASFAF